MEEDKPISTQPLSYKDKLTRSLHGMYEHSILCDKLLDKDTDDDLNCSKDQLEAPSRIKFFLSKEGKIRIRNKYKSSLIIKLIGKSIHYNYFVIRLMSLWKLTGELDCILLGQSFYLIKFNNKEYFD